MGETIMAVYGVCFVGIIVVGMILVVGFRILNWVWLRPKKMEKYLREQGFNGTPYKLLFGDLKEMMAMSDEARSKPISLSDDIVPRVIPFFHKSLNDYGKNFYNWLGPTPLIHIMDPDLVKDILSKYHLFQKPKGGNPLGELLAKGLVSAEAEQWVKHRKIINPAFHVEKLKHMVPAFYLCCSEMINKWDKLVPSERSCEVDVWPHLQTLTSDVISRTAFGSSYEEGRKIFELQNEQAEMVMKTVQSIYVPGSRFLPTKTNRRMKEIAKEVKAIIRNIIDKRMVAMKSGEMNNDDLLGILLESNYKLIQQVGNGNSGLSIDDVIEECKLFYFAGQETTSTLLVWTMILLSHHSSWQERARNEVLQVFGKSKPHVDGLNRLKIVTMIFNEVLRLYPALVTLNRMNHEEINLGEITLPAGVIFNLHALLLHHDIEIWGDDAKEFNPERFSEGVSKVTKGQAIYFPFGGGPRICIGQNFALLEAKMALTMILQRFSFTLSPSYSHALFTIVTLQPQHGAPLILNKL